AQDELQTPREHLITWLSDWVRDYGIDGFRVDTAKHVEMEAWAELKASTTQALAQWKQNNPDKALDDLPFWMTGEVWAHSV
ncbi:alpha-amylase family glycosyl hydrolase, partial [Escherichia coli]|nr:alpha-amylase family glycosyl hydrolase [Escherichia coli]